MPEIILKYKNKKTLEALQDLAKYFDYVISTPGLKEKKKQKSLNGITIIPADSSVNASDLTDVFTGKELILKNSEMKHGKGQSNLRYRRDD